LPLQGYGLEIFTVSRERRLNQYYDGERHANSTPTQLLESPILTACV